MIDDLLDVARIASGQAAAGDAAGRLARRGARGGRRRGAVGQGETGRDSHAPRRPVPADPGDPAAPPAGRLEPALERGEIHRTRRARRGAGDARRENLRGSSSPTRATASAPSSCRSSSSGSGKATAPAPGATAAWGSGSRSSAELVELHGGQVVGDERGRTARGHVHRRFADGHVARCAVQRRASTAGAPPTTRRRSPGFESSSSKTKTTRASS